MFIVEGEGQKFLPEINSMKTKSDSWADIVSHWFIIPVIKYEDDEISRTIEDIPEESCQK